MATYKVIDGHNVFRRRFEKIGATAMQVMYYEACAATPEVPHLWVWDATGAKRRRQAICPAYKAKRTGAGDEFHKTVELFQQLLGYTPAMQVSVEGYEGDDVIAALVPLITANGNQMLINSSDADFLVLESALVKVESDKKIEQNPKYMRLYKTLVGDKSDEIPGIKGFGDKAFAALEESELQLLQAHFEGRQELGKADVMELLGWSEAIATKWAEGQTELKQYWEVIGFFPIATEVLAANFKVGTPNPAAAAEILNRFIFTMDAA
jgi:5'-3' exonuclease